MEDRDRSLPAVSVRSADIGLYCVVQVGKTLLWVANDLIAFYVLAVSIELSPMAITLMLTGGLAWHGLSDLGAGWLSERFGGAASGLARLVGVAVPLSSVAFVAMVLLASEHFLLAIVAMLVSRSAYSLFDVPHHALLGRMVSCGANAGRLVGQRNLWGQVGSLILAMAVTPWLAHDMSRATLAVLLAMVALVTTLLSLPVVPLLLRYWAVADDPASDRPATIAPQRSRRFVPLIVAAHLAITFVVATVAKVAVSTPAPLLTVPGIALSALMSGRLLASVPLPGALAGRGMPVTFVATLALLLGAVGWIMTDPVPFAVLGFGFLSGLINILTWSWIAQANVRPRMFAVVAMTGKAGMALAIPAAAVLVAAAG